MACHTWAFGHASQEIVQERLRNGGHNLFVQEGWMMSMGNKKVVKLFCRPLSLWGWLVFQDLELGTGSL